MTEIVSYLSATDLGLKPGDLVLVAPEAVRAKTHSPFHALQPDQLARRVWRIEEVNHAIVFGAAVRTGRDGAPLTDAAGNFLVDGYTHRHFPNSAPIFQPASSIGNHVE